MSTENVEKPEDAVRCTGLMGEPERKEDVKERRWWEVKSRRNGEPWRNSGNTPLREEVDEFVKRGAQQGFDVQVWEVVAVERTERVKQLETGSPIDPSAGEGAFGASVGGGLSTLLWTWNRKPKSPNAGIRDRSGGQP